MSKRYLTHRNAGLGTIDKYYDVAISNCAQGLDNIVVDNKHTAKECIKLLKKYNAGKTSFIAMDEMEQYKRKITNLANLKLPSSKAEKMSSNAFLPMGPSAETRL